MGIYISSVVMGIALAATTRLKMTLPFLILGLAIHFGWGQVRPAAGTEWLGSWPAIIAFGVAVILEFVADNVPAVDHVLDVSEAFIAPVAGAFITIAASGMAKFDPLLTLVLGLIGAGVGAGAYFAHNPIKRAAVDASGAQLTGSTLASSVAETTVASIEAVVATIWPWLALILILVSIVVGIVVFVFLKKKPGLISVIGGVMAVSLSLISCVPGLGLLSWFTLVWSIGGLWLAFKGKSVAGGSLNLLALLISGLRIAGSAGALF